MTLYPCPKPMPAEPEPKAQKTTRQKTDPAIEAWKADVKSRAGIVCEMAGLQHKCWGGSDVHHVIGKGAHPRLRVDPDNGCVLCRGAHDLVHRKRWFKPYFWAWFMAKYPGRRGRLEAKAQREGRIA
jgi:hypothetical protein